MKPQVSHPLFARVYHRLRPAMDRNGAAEHRRRLLAGAAGSVVEVGAGDGANFALYPGEVTSVIAVEPEQFLRLQAERSAAEAAVTVEVVNGTADRLPVSDRSVDVVVASLVLCSVPDQRAALTEAMRVLRPGGELRFYEHVAAEAGTRLARVQTIANATVWPRLMAGCHVGRNTVATIMAAGFRIEELDQFRFPADQPSPASPHVLGRAVRPVAP